MYGDSKTPAAIIYRHGDGYPEGAGVDLKRFFKECATLPDTRFNDPPYLAAKYVVWLANEFNWTYDFKGEKMERIRPASRLEFLSVGICMEDPGDIEYRYTVSCGKMIEGEPELKCYPVDREGKNQRAVKIPDIPEKKDAA